jgi:hypothetical protein
VRPLSPIISALGTATNYLDPFHDRTNKFYRIQVVP